MNKKYIIGILVAGAVIGGAYYLYSRNKKNGSTKKNMTTDKDALQVADILGKKDTPMDAEKLKKWIPAYTSTISKDEHESIIKVINKPDSTWSSEDKVIASKLLDVTNKAVNS